MKTLQQIQREIGEWAQQQFSVNSASAQSHHKGSVLQEIPSFYGMVSELGELAALDVREMQGRSKLSTESERDAARKDALGDLLVFACDYACRMDVDLNEALDAVWAKVQKRRQATWEQDKAKEQPTKEGQEAMVQDRAGFGAGCEEGNHEWLFAGGSLNRFQCKVCGIYGRMNNAIPPVINVVTEERK